MLNLCIAGCVIGMLTGCAPTQVTTVSQSGGQLPRPDRILVYDFIVSPDEVKLDRGISAKLEDLAKGTSRSEEERAVGQKVADALSKHLVKEIQNLGFVADRTSGPFPTMGNILVIDGQFISIDEGNRTERVIIGLGAGRTDVKASVQVNYARGGERIPVSQFETDAKSGYKPGAAETIGAGAAAGHLVTSAAVSVGGDIASETLSATVEADANRTAKAIVERLNEYFVSQGWIQAGGQ